MNMYCIHELHHPELCTEIAHWQPTSGLWKAVVDVPCNLQRVVEDSTTRCRM